MCGISLYAFNRPITNQDILTCLESFQKISHRGPDSSYIKIIHKCNLIICFHRLAINDTTLKGDQPFLKMVDSNEYYLICNGEIYNHLDIESFFQIENESRSDCECLINRMIKTNMNFNFNYLNSEHAMIFVKINQNSTYELVASVDRFSVRPLFIGESDEVLFFSSELQGIPNSYENIKISRFSSSTYMKVKYDFISFEKETVKYFDITKFIKEPSEQTFFESEEDVYKLMIKDCMSEAVRKRLMSDRKIGVFLSGGLDSLIVSYETMQHLGSVDSFSIGLPGSDDEIWAKKSSIFLGTNHTHFEITIEEYLEAIIDTIKAIGSFDTTTVRASIVQYLCSKKISGVRVLLSGDGSDELNFSYDDNFHCPNEEEFTKRTIHYLENIYTSDGLRADRCVSRFGLELRIPFLDIDLVKTTLNIPVKYRWNKTVSKPLLRKAYEGLIPDELLYRPKVTFSDGVGNKENQSRDILTNYFNSLDIEMTNEFDYHCKPTTKEEFYYRSIFAQTFGYEESIAKTIPFYWKPIFKKSIDPSAWYTAAI